MRIKKSPFLLLEVCIGIALLTLFSAGVLSFATNYFTHTKKNCLELECARISEQEYVKYLEELTKNKVLPLLPLKKTEAIPNIETLDMTVGTTSQKVMRKKLTWRGRNKQNENGPSYYVVHHLISYYTPKNKELSKSLFSTFVTVEANIKKS